MDLGKIRAGYARVGGDASIFATNLYYGTLGAAINGNALGNVDNNVPNANIEPLQVTEMEFGAEFDLVGGRIFTDFAIYNKQTLNDIVPVGISRGSGYQNAVVNVGKIENKGFEFLLGGVPVLTESFKWTSTFNYTINRNSKYLRSHI